MNYFVVTVVCAITLFILQQLRNKVYNLYESEQETDGKERLWVNHPTHPHLKNYLTWTYVQGLKRIQYHLYM